MPALDRLSPLLERFRVRTSVFHTGPLCGETRFPAEPGRGFLHVLRGGRMEVSHRGSGGAVERRRIDEPSLVFSPRPLEHVFHTPATRGSDFACAALDIEGGAMHPLVRTLPDLIVLPLDQVDTLGPVLELLFAELDHVACGQRLIADRLFEVALIRLFRWMLDNPDRLALPVGLLPGLRDPRLAPLLVAVHEGPGRTWTLATMAREARMSRSTFAAAFREVVGQPPADYVTDWRLTVAQDRLRGGASVAVVAAEIGYASASSLSRVFAQRVGQSPRAWLAAA